MPDLAEILKNGDGMLAAAGIPESRREATSLIAAAIDRDRSFLYAHPEYHPSPNDMAKIDEFLRRRAEREPFQYILGLQEFYGLEFEVTPDVLIPRPETEFLVERGIAYLKALEKPDFLDIGTGTGCIVISILKNCPSAIGTAVDISPAALEVAKRNAERNGAADRLQLFESDLFANVQETAKFHLIVSNPPYVPAKDMPGLQAEVRDFEPHVALTDGFDGVSIIAEIVRAAPAFLLPGGHLLIEMGFGQADRVQAMMSSELWEEAQIEPDLQGIPRVLVAKLR